MKNIKHLIFTLALAAILSQPGSVSANGVIHEAHTPSTRNYTAYCDGNYHGLRNCEVTENFSFGSEQIVTAITMNDIGCNSRDTIEAFFFYDLVDAESHGLVTETTQSRHKVCEPDYAPEHDVPVTLTVNPVRLQANHNYYVILRASNNAHIRAYWGADSTNQTSFKIHGTAAGKEPVMLIPGIMGSSLKRASDGMEIWPNVNEMVFSASDSHLDDLKLAVDGSQIPGKDIVPGEVIERASFSLFGQDTVTQSFYGDLVKQFTDHGYTLGLDLFEFAYDWRLDLRSQVARLKSALDSARLLSAGDKVGIVAHSMGGLLAKQYLAVPENAAGISSVVLAGVPQLGAPSMFKVLNHGDNLGFRFPIIQKDLLNPLKVKAIAQNMPGAYELLPSRNYVSAAGGYVKDFRSGGSKTLSHQEAVALMTASSTDSRNPNLLVKGQDFHDGLDGQPITGPRVYNVAACGNPATLGEIHLYDNGKMDIASADGDGTVPLASAMDSAGTYTNYYIHSPSTGIDHGGLVRDERATALIQRLVENVDASFVPGIGKSPEICAAGQTAVDGVRFSTHSPVALHVYDFSGHHTGPAADGSVDLGIPGSSHTVLGENSFVFAPAGETYRVVIDGLSSGRFSLKAETFAGSKLVASTNYLNVPLAGDSTSAEAIFSGGAMDPDLKLDNEGDGTVDSNISPTALLLGSAAEDSEPPQISYSGIPVGSVVAGTPFTVTFSASDVLSGVATTSATLNGIGFSSGSTLTSSSTGRQVIVIQATDKAGNPRVFSAEFNQTAAPAPVQPIQPNQSQQQSAGASGKTSKSAGGTGAVLGATTTTVIQSQTGAKGPAVCLAVPKNTLGRGRNNDRNQVTLLQAFLGRELNLNIPTTGFFGPITEIAVKIFQLKHHADILAPAKATTPTGFVGQYTLAKMAALACQ